jgi:hypothetical protein
MQRVNYEGLYEPTLVFRGKKAALFCSKSKHTIIFFCSELVIFLHNNLPDINFQNKFVLIIHFYAAFLFVFIITLL